MKDNKMFRDYSRLNENEETKQLKATYDPEWSPESTCQKRHSLGQLAKFK